MRTKTNRKEASRRGIFPDAIISCRVSLLNIAQEWNQWIFPKITKEIQRTKYNTDFLLRISQFLQILLVG